jgi:hypothetical protein
VPPGAVPLAAFPSFPEGSCSNIFRFTSLAFLCLAACSLAHAAAAQANGISSSATNTVGLWANGTEYLHISSTGDVGIGTTAPATNLDVRGQEVIQTSSSNLTSTQLGMGGWAFGGLVVGDSAASTYSGLAIGGTYRAATNVPMGLISFNNFNVNSSLLSTEGAVIYAYPDDTTTTDLGMNLAFDTLQSGGSMGERMRITSAGNVGIGTPAPTTLLHVYTTASSAITETQHNGTGTCTFTPTTGATSYSCSSDARLKKDIVDAGMALPWVGDMRVRDYTVKADGSRMTGIIAQELLKTHPDMVHMGPDGYYTAEAPNPWKLVKAIQELKADNDELRHRDEELNAANESEAAQIKILAARIEALEAVRR